MLTQKHVGCQFSITVHAYGSLTLTCGNESFDMSYDMLSANALSLFFSISENGKQMIHKFIALGDQDKWSYVGVTEEKHYV